MFLIREGENVNSKTGSYQSNQVVEPQWISGTGRSLPRSRPITSLPVPKYSAIAQRALAYGEGFDVICRPPETIKAQTTTETQTPIQPAR